MRRISGVCVQALPIRARRKFVLQQFPRNSLVASPRKCLNRQSKYPDERINSRRHPKIIDFNFNDEFNDEFAVGLFFFFGGGSSFLAIYIPVIEAATLKLQNSVEPDYKIM